MDVKDGNFVFGFKRHICCNWRGICANLCYLRVVLADVDDLWDMLDEIFSK